MPVRATSTFRRFKSSSRYRKFSAHEHIRDICRRLAQEGYLAIAPELYFARAIPMITTIFLLYFRGWSKRCRILRYWLTWITSPAGLPATVAMPIVCLLPVSLGRSHHLASHAAHKPQLKAAVAWYGKLVGEKTLNSPKHPVDIAVDLNAPVCGLYGAKDDSIPQDTIETMRQALRAANATAEIVVYPQADHAFNADYRASYHEESAKDGWQRMLARFAQYGGKRG
jgi:carboxymethylenebutenolidase